jgi:hypothetical protein
LFGFANQKGKQMKIHIENCQNILSGDVEIALGKKNIKYGVNGTGKSTIAKAITSYLGNEPLDKLTPFSSTEETPLTPTLTFGDSYFTGCVVFNQNYIDDKLFVDANQIVTDPFSVFFKPDGYDESVQQINESAIELNDIKRQDLMQTFFQFALFLQENVKITSSTGKYSKQSLVAPLLANGNLLVNKKRTLVPFSTLIGGERAAWLNWHKKGEVFARADPIHCPYCGLSFADYPSRQASAKDVNLCLTPKAAAVYDAFSGMIPSAQKLLSPSRYSHFQSIAKGVRRLKKPETWLAEMTNEANLIASKIVSGEENFSLTEPPETYFKDRKIQISSLRYFRSTPFRDLIKQFNQALSKIDKNRRELKIAISRLQSSISKRFVQTKGIINDFLKESGTPYELVLNETDPSNKTIGICPVGQSASPIPVKDNFSFGEGNALAIALFALQVSAGDSHTLYILDDPISDYDEGKTLAISNLLFGNDTMFNNRTMLILTHSLQTVLPYAKEHSQFPESLNMSYLQNRCGTLSELPIPHSKFVSAIRNHYQNASDPSLSLITRLIHLRQYIELVNVENNSEMNCAYDVISSLKENKQPYRKDDEETEIPLTEEQKEKGFSFIKRYISDFDYDSAMHHYCDAAVLIQDFQNAKDDYEKVLLFRLIAKYKPIHDPDALCKFVTEYYHVENEMLFQINPHEFNAIPPYLIKAIEEEVART